MWVQTTTRRVTVIGAALLVGAAGCSAPSGVDASEPHRGSAPTVSPEPSVPRTQRRSWEAFGPDRPKAIEADGRGIVAVGATGETIYFERSSPKPRWGYDVEVDPRARPALSAGSVIVAGGDEVVAVDRVSGELRWVAQVEDAGLAAYAGTSPDGVFAVSSGLSTIVALDERTGATRWSLDDLVTGPEATIAVTGGGSTVVVSDDSVASGRLRGIDVATGATRWERTLPGPASVPVVVDEIVLVAANAPDGGIVTAVEASTGAQRWIAETEAGFPARIEQGVGDDAVAVVDVEGTVHLLDRATGHTFWEQPTGTPLDNTRVGVTTRAVLVPTSLGVLRLDRGTGEMSGERVFLGSVQDADVTGDTLVQLVAVAGSSAVELSDA